jgi:hypothetical protein
LAISYWGQNKKGKRGLIKKGVREREDGVDVGDECAIMTTKYGIFIVLHSTSSVECPPLSSDIFSFFSLLSTAHLLTAFCLPLPFLHTTQQGEAVAMAIAQMNTATMATCDHGTVAKVRGHDVYFFHAKAIYFRHIAVVLLLSRAVKARTRLCSYQRKMHHPTPHSLLILT